MNAEAIQVPIPTLWYKLSSGQASKRLWIMLPGIDQPANVFEENGYIEKLAQARFAADVVAVDANLNYYLERVLTQRIMEDIVLPAREQGYQQIYLIGISMGALGVLLFLRKHTETLDGVFAIAPFLGDPQVIEEIAACGGLRRWQPQSVPDYEEDYQRSLWFWLKQYDQTANGQPPLFLGFGQSDEFAPANQILAAVLPRDRVFIAAGGHDWDCWNRILALFLENGAF